MNQQKSDAALNRAIEYIINSSEDYCQICPRIKECNAESLEQGDEWEQSKDLCRAMLKKHFMKE